MAAEWYWHDGVAWVAYEQGVAHYLNAALAAGSSTAWVAIGGRQYLIDFARHVQRNPASGFERPVWCGPNPPLQWPSLVHQPTSSVPSSSLKRALQCSAWPIGTAEDGLPAFWECRPTGGLLRLDPNCEEAGAVVSRWLKGPASRVSPNRITTICRVEHPERWRRYQQRKAELCQAFPEDAPEGGVKELHLFHGSRRDSIKSILEAPQGIDASQCSRGLYGRGSYFALDHSTSDAFALVDQNGEKHIILCRVLIGRMRVGDQSINLKPADCDTTVNSGLGIFCKFDNSEKYEEYVVSYR